MAGQPTFGGPGYCRDCGFFSRRNSEQSKKRPVCMFLGEKVRPEDVRLDCRGYHPG